LSRKKEPLATISFFEPSRLAFRGDLFMQPWVRALMKKKSKFSSNIRKFRVEQLQLAVTYITNGLLIYGEILRISSYIRKPFLIYDFATAPL
jgi:hypothetical protein